MTEYAKRGDDGGDVNEREQGGSSRDRTSGRWRSRRAQVTAAAALLAMTVAAAVLLTVTRAGAPPLPQVRLSDALTLASSGGVIGASIDDRARTVTLTLPAERVDDVRRMAAAASDGDEVTVVVPADGRDLEVVSNYPDGLVESVTATLTEAEVPIDITRAEAGSPATAVVAQVIPILVVLGGAYLLLTRASAGVARSTASSASAVTDTGIRFRNVAGCDEAIEDLSDVVRFLSDPDRYRSIGASAPRGVLLEGPPGTGKTLLARAVAGEAGVPFFAVSGSDFVNLFVGAGARNVRSLFAKAAKAGRAVVFIDEIDAIGKQRSDGPSNGGTDERENTLNALLVEMDGFARSDVIVLAATNRADLLDNALTRPGRFDRKVTVPLPDRAGRTRILEVHAGGRPMADDVDLVGIARRTPGASGADLAALLNEAAIVAANAEPPSSTITAAHVEQALQTQMLGRARTSALVTDRDRTITAWHEAGHTVAALVLPDADDPVAVTIVPRGPAGGVTWMSGSDQQFLTRSEARAKLVVMLAGRAAEEILLDGDFTQGAGGDLMSATDLALKMVTQYGMGPTLSVVTADRYAAGGSTARVDDAVDALLAQALDDARTLVAEHRPTLEQLVEWLLEHETVDTGWLDRLRPAA